MLPYQPPWWLRNAHAQTIYAAKFAPRPRVAWQRERWDTPDGDFIDLDWLVPRRAIENGASPLVVLFHGLEGDSQSHYAHTLMHAVEQRGWRGVLVHFRGCSGEPNRLPRSYHAGDSAELDWILARLRRRYADSRLFAVGVSLGGNVLLKWLGERAHAASAVIAAACTVSAPLDLTAAGMALDRGFNRIYTWRFLRTLRKKALAKIAAHPGVLDADAAQRARTLRTFDDAVTAPLHGFAGVLDYWSRASSKPWLKHIEVPTLVLNARDDTFLPAQALPIESDVSDAVALECPEHGGHVAFVTHAFPGRVDWMPERVIGFLASHACRDDPVRPRMA